MSQVEQLITDNLDVWTSAIKKRGSQGRGSSKKIELYGIKKLRELILDLAVRGLLVPQISNEESAEVLLKNLVADKIENVKFAKKNKVKKQMEIGIEYSLDAIPKGWAWALIPQVISDDKYAIKRGPFGSAIKKSFFVSSGYKVYEQQHAIQNDFSIGEYYIDEEKYQELSAFSVNPNDLIISCSGTVGKVAVAPDWMEPGIINQALLKISLNQSALINEYFKILFSAYYMKTETLNDLKGTAQKNMVSVDTLKKEPFPLPPYLEQYRIVAKVDELMALCDQLEQQTEDSLSAHQTLVETLLNALLDAAQSRDDSSSKESAFDQAWQRIAEHFDVLFTTEHSIDQLKQTILQLAVMGKLVPQDPNDEPASVLLEKIAAEKERLVKEGKIKKQKPLPEIGEDEKPFELPVGWEWCYLSSLATFENGDRSSRYPNKADLVDSGIPFFGAPDIESGKLAYGDDLRFISEEKFSELSNGKLIDRDFVMLLRGTVGKVAQYHSNERHSTGFINAQMLIIRLIDTEVDSYMAKFFISSVFSSDIGDKISGAVIRQIPASAIAEIKLPLPPKEERVKIGEKVDELMALCDSLKIQIKESQTTQLHLADAMAEQAIN